jgi:hypothetical protein
MLTRNGHCVVRIRDWRFDSSIQGGRHSTPWSRLEHRPKCGARDDGTTDPHRRERCGSKRNRRVVDRASRSATADWQSRSSKREPLTRAFVGVTTGSSIPDTNLRRWFPAIRRMRRSQHRHVTSSSTATSTCNTVLAGGIACSRPGARPRAGGHPAKATTRPGSSHVRRSGSTTERAESIRASRYCSAMTRSSSVKSETLTGRDERSDPATPRIRIGATVARYETSLWASPCRGLRGDVWGADDCDASPSRQSATG